MYYSYKNRNNKINDELLKNSFYIDDSIMD